MPRTAYPQRTLAMRAVSLTLCAIMAHCKRGSQPARALAAPAAASASTRSEGLALAQRFECSRCHTRAGLPPSLLRQDCVQCHLAVREGRFPGPEEARARWRSHVVDLVVAPRLEGLSRLHSAWVEAFLLHPSDVRPHLPATMPRLALSQAQAHTLAAWLTDVGAEPPTPTDQLPQRALVPEGRALFSRYQCTQCHNFSDAAVAPREPALTDATRLAPLLDLARERMRPAQIAHWIARPTDFAPHTSMPTLGISSREALALASYVMFAPLRPRSACVVPPLLPLLRRPVSFAEVQTEVFAKTCHHCHADGAFAWGDGGPGNTGGFGFAARGLELATYRGVMSGVLVGGQRESIFAEIFQGVSRLEEVLRQRQRETCGDLSGPVRGMPLGHPAVTAEALQLVRTWVAQGRPLGTTAESQ
ncbi:MAG: cytochrome c [Deltaproteobacteria bacterium]|nr:cytochrome c [Deltaproteobacteria bacterium]